MSQPPSGVGAGVGVGVGVSAGGAPGAASTATGSTEAAQKHGLPARVAQWYYKHGLFLSSYPTCAFSISIVVIFLCCYPLKNVPLPGTIPTKVIIPYTTPIPSVEVPSQSSTDSNNGSLYMNGFLHTFEPPFPWAQTEPFIYVQQILFKSTVAPWTADLRISDAFRGPIYEVFKLLDIVRNHVDEKTKTTLGHICFHVENVKKTSGESPFPEYNCLLLSPANLWQQNLQAFNRDPNLLTTIFQYHSLQKTQISIADMLFGMPLKNTGIKRYPIRVRQRTIQFAVTLILRENDQKYLQSLRDKLTSIYPLHQNPERTATVRSSVTYIFYPSDLNVMEFLPLYTAFGALFIAVYFSIGKIGVIKSGLTLAFFATLTVIGSLVMSLGLCFFFGLTISMQSKGIFPYLIILVGLENVLIITKSVVCTENSLDVKIRIAQGLSNEGWSISKTLLTEITILTVGLATFVPVTQEFCIFAIVGLISDFMLQMLFFTTTLASNIKRVDYDHMPKHVVSFIEANQKSRHIDSSGVSSTINRSISTPTLSSLDTLYRKQSGNANVSEAAGVSDREIPKRWRVVNFLTRTRFFQRAFMIRMIVWISTIVYNSGVIEQIFLVGGNSSLVPGISTQMGRYQLTNVTDDNRFLFDALKSKPLPEVSGGRKGGDDAGQLPPLPNNVMNLTEQLNRLKYPDYDANYLLSNFHWSAILRNYNISLSGKYVTILPTIKLSHSVSPETAVHLRNPKEKSSMNFQWKALAAALDPIDFTDIDNKVEVNLQNGNLSPLPLYPKSPIEILLAAILCSISVFVLAYTMVVLYRCICTRNYAEWRSSWNDGEMLPLQTQRVLERAPINLDGHTHQIECLATDGTTVASSCLEGQINIWDANNGERLGSIDRAEYRHSNGGGSSPIWCLDFSDNIVVVGCADGKLEFWEATHGKLKCVFNINSNPKCGVTHVKLVNNRVIVARLNGCVDFLKLSTYYHGQQIDWSFTSAYRRTHVRTGSTGSLTSTQPFSNHFQSHSATALPLNSAEEWRCTLECQQKGHQQPITCMDVASNYVFTGSQDHTLKIFALERQSLVYTLHGHCGPITCLFIESEIIGGSGSQDGLLCVWDLKTGACMYSIQAHDGSIVSLTKAPSYVISLGADEKMCIWERFQGHLLNTINVSHVYSSMLMLTPSLLITGKPGSLIIWDVRTGEAAREVKLDCANMQHTPKMMLLALGSVICDYGNEIRIVPLVAGDKSQ